MDWRGIVWFTVLYVVGYSIHNEPARLSFTFGAPSALALVCGRPLRSNKLEFSPMVLQLVGLAGLTVLLVRQFGLVDRRTSLWILLGLQLACLLGVLIPVLRNVAKGVRSP
jgi:hypothetical protein